MKKGYKSPQEHSIERHVLGLGEHWSGKASLRIWFLSIDLKCEQETGEEGGGIGRSIPSRGKQSVKDFVVGGDCSMFKDLKKG